MVLLRFFFFRCCLCFFWNHVAAYLSPQKRKGGGNVASVLRLNFISCDVTFVVFEASIYLHHQSSEILSPLTALTRHLNVSVHLLRSTPFASLEKERKSGRKKKKKARTLEVYTRFLPCLTAGARRPHHERRNFFFSFFFSFLCRALPPH